MLDPELVHSLSRTTQQACQGGAALPGHNGFWWLLGDRAASFLYTIWNGHNLGFPYMQVWQKSSLAFVAEETLMHQVYKCKFWMWHYGARTPKPTIIWSGSSGIQGFWTRQLKRSEVRAEEKQRNPSSLPAPVHRYEDAAGQSKFHGTVSMKMTGSRT